MLLDFTPSVKCTPTQARKNPDLYDASVADAARWKARHVNRGEAGAYIEIRRMVGGANIVILVALDGWDISKYESRTPDRWGRSTKGKNVRISMNGSTSLVYADIEEMRQAVYEARHILEDDAISKKGSIGP